MDYTRSFNFADHRVGFKTQANNNESIISKVLLN